MTQFDGARIRNYEELTDRELDALCNQHLMDSRKDVDFWRPSQFIDSAFKVVEAMRERGLEVTIMSEQTPAGPNWQVSFTDNDIQVDVWGDVSLPRAIFIAALRACDE